MGTNNCAIQQILFVLDTSGSIGQTNFNEVTAKLSELTAFFCRPIEIAVMTFDHEYFVEFCFNKYENDCCGRKSASHAISSIPYTRQGQSGTRWTHTAGAARCVCNHMLHSICGFRDDCKSVTVVFLTDGHANDPAKNVCTEIRCLHNQTGVETFAIGIGNSEVLKLKCMLSNPMLNEYRLFNFPTFEQFNAHFTKLIIKLVDPQSVYECADTSTDPTVGTTNDRVRC